MIIWSLNKKMKVLKILGEVILIKIWYNESLNEE